MFRRIVAIAIIAALALTNVTCIRYKSEKVFKQEVPLYTETITEAILATGEVVEFGPRGGTYSMGRNAITGRTREGKFIEVPLDEVLYVRVKKVDPGLSLVATVGGIAAGLGLAYLVILAVKESCPFVYAYDGENYVFDAEPLGGSITWGLRKADFSRLEHLQPVDDKYHLLVRNEVEEIQYLDQMKLLVIDHAPGEKIIPDVFGSMHIVSDDISPLSVRDETGRNLIPFFEGRDDVAWQTYLPRDDSYKREDLRHTLTFEFPRPAGADNVKLIVNAGTALWGSNMIREMLQLRGDKVDEWYQGVNRGGREQKELERFIGREELYVLKVYVKEDGEWVQRGFIPGGGPLILEDRVIPLDLSGVTGDTLAIRLNPPMGFWSIDYLGVAFDDQGVLQPQEVALGKAKDHDGKSIHRALREADDQYVEMPEVGDWFKIEFDVPVQQYGTERSIFLQSTGYYEIQIDKDQPERTALILELLDTPGMIVEYAMDEYLKWRELQVSAK